VIFVTVGSEIAFDRMLSVVDNWAASTGEEVFAQIGPSEMQLSHVQYKQFLPPAEYQNYIKHCTAIIAHAGMGTILSAMQHCKPVVIMPRMAKYQETRNDHQVATARRLGNRAGIYVAMDEDALKEQLTNIHLLKAGGAVSSYASDELIETIKCFIDGKSK